MSTLNPAAVRQGSIDDLLISRFREMQQRKSIVIDDSEKAILQLPNGTSVELPILKGTSGPPVIDGKTKYGPIH